MKVDNIVSTFLKTFWYLLRVLSTNVPRLYRLISQVMRSTHLSLSKTLRAKLDILSPISLKLTPKLLPFGVGIVMTGIGKKKIRSGIRSRAGSSRNKIGRSPAFKRPRSPRPFKPLIPRSPAKPASPPMPPPAPSKSVYPASNNTRNTYENREMRNNHKYYFQETSIKMWSISRFLAFSLQTTWKCINAHCQFYMILMSKHQIALFSELFD